MPLADDIRPAKIADIIGQEHILGEGKPLSKIIESEHPTNLIFYGPPGVGKTTTARLIAFYAGLHLFVLDGTSVSTADLKEVISQAVIHQPSILYLDEIQYLNKKQQQTLLKYIEDGSIILIASTTENPYFSIYPAILSRCTVFEFKPVTPEQLTPVILKAVNSMEFVLDRKFHISEGAMQVLGYGCGGDVRKCINTVELACITSDSGELTEELIKSIVQRSNMNYDRDGDQHFDMLSALHKSIRGSDENAALHYAARLLVAGELTAVCRRLLCVAAEDVGLAYPQIIPIVKSCVDSAVQLGMPEARLPIANAIILMCTSPKSNSACVAIDSAIRDVQNGAVYNIPRHLQNTHCDGVGNSVLGQNYLYPHSYPNHYVKQQYLPDEMTGVIYYHFGDNKFEQAALDYRNQLLK